MATRTFQMGDNITCEFRDYEDEHGVRGYNFDIYGTGYMFDSFEDFYEVGGYGDPATYLQLISRVYQNDVIIPDGILSIAEGCFESVGSRIYSETIQRFSGVYNIFIGEDVEYIGVAAFRKSVVGGGIHNVILTGDNPKLRYIKEDAFWYQMDLVTCDFRGLVDTIGNNAFRGCYKLESIGLADNWEFDADYFDASVHHTFEDCYMLKSISEHNTIVDINGNGNFNYWYCNNLTYVTINNPIDEHPSASNRNTNGLGLTVGLWGTDENGNPISGLDAEYDENGNLKTEIDTEFDEYFDPNYVRWQGYIYRSVIKVSKFKVYVYHMGRRIELKGGNTGDIPVAHEGQWKYLRCAKDSENPAYSPIHFAHNGHWYQFKY